MEHFREHRKSLLKRSIGDLRTLAAVFTPPIELAANDTKARIINKIIEREETEAKKEIPSVRAGAGSESLPPRPDFEAAASAPEPEPEPERRGGPRPRPGRPLGMTDEKAAVKNLPKQPNMAIRQGVYVAGQAWATSVKIPAVAFDDEETDLIALPLSQLQEFYFPGLIPEIAAVWVSLAYGLAKVVKVRLDLIKAVQAARKEGKNVETIVGNREQKDEKATESGKERQSGALDH